MMNLANMRENDCRSIELQCECGHWATANVDRFPDSALVPELRLRFRCSKCGRRPRLSRPSVQEWGKRR